MLFVRCRRLLQIFNFTRVLQGSKFWLSTVHLIIQLDFLRKSSIWFHQKISMLLTKVNPKFSINKAAVELFEYLFYKLSQMRNQLIDGLLVVTGRGLGGYLAILFTLWKQHPIDVEESNASKYTKRPICITFGSPLVGNDALQRAISERPRWKSCFLNVVTMADCVASFFSSNNSQYKPFGTFLFCTESGGNATFEDQEEILTVLDIMGSSNVGNLETYDYGNILNSMRRNLIVGLPDWGNSSTRIH